MAKLPYIKDLAELIRVVKRQVPHSNSADAGDYIPEGGTVPAVTLTVGWDSETGDWSYQTGNNSYTGGAYPYPYWGVVEVERRSNSEELARDIRRQLDEATW